MVGKITSRVADAKDQRRFIQTKTTAGSHRIASHHFALVFGNWITSAERTLVRNTSEVSRRDDVELRYSMAAEISVEASRRIATETIGVGRRLTLHKYKPAA